MEKSFYKAITANHMAEKQIMKTDSSEQEAPMLVQMVLLSAGSQIQKSHKVGVVTNRLDGVHNPRQANNIGGDSSVVGDSSVHTIAHRLNMVHQLSEYDSIGSNYNC